ncbi:unnamed protein product [Didymodactylos carnosus]|uniref:Poly [ADP-ribose] polymerase n=2 Tax=Didymodactylos carnosus TaxID=1234261 RepID=A0A8S2DGM5_9BILA|nr:unnamed protein product [Didymodactylos carnosus]CAF3671744.1 unnamed protein product [Didymodactylos carnosus]
MINIPIYDLKTKQTVLKEIHAAESTIKQRLGRLGRTKPGEYYSLYDFKVGDKKYPTPQICQSDLINIEFTLRKSPMKNGLNYMKKFLPNAPDPQAIQLAIEELRKLHILTPQDQFTSVGVSIAKLPDFGSLAMSKSILSALTQNNCGQDLIILSSILSVLNTSSLLKALPNQMKSSDGDFMTLLKVMSEILLVKRSVPAYQFNLEKICHAKGLVGIQHILKQALRRYVSLEKSFNLSDDYRQKAQRSSAGEWELIARSLLNGYSENVFVSMKELQGKTHQFTRYQSSAAREDFAVLDLQSTLTRSISSAPVSVILARDIRYSSSVRATAVLSFVGEIKSEWIDRPMERIIKLNTAEETKLNSDSILSNAKQTFTNLQISLNNNHELILKGPSGSVLEAELDIIQQLVVPMKFNLTNDFNPTSSEYKSMKRNLESVMKMPRIFNPMKWRWEAQQQVKITINTTNGVCEITIEGRDSRNQLAQKEFQSFLRWLKTCAVIRHPNSGVSPRILKPEMRKTCLAIEEKISHVTDSKRTSIDLWNGLKGSKATRETRMEVVAWIAVCQFDCRVEGGFVRDWIVGNYTQRPTGNAPPSTWISYNVNPANVPIPYMSKELIPSDLDCHLPTHAYFDIDKFLDYLHKYQIDCKVFREDWRYVLLLDENAKTGPFTMDLIEPHVALTHDRIDFDVSNLSLEKDYTKELGMRVDIQQKPYSIELETIVDNIKNKRFKVLRPIDDIVQLRITKMVQTRGWTQLGEPMHVIPDPPPKYQVVLVPLPQSTALYQLIVQQMKTIGNQVKVLSIEQIKNPLLEDAYLANKKLIAKQCTGQNPNERELFHGTKGDAIDGILENGFDDRYWGTNYSKGNWGHGAYFADNPVVSHNYTSPDPTDQTRIMYYNKVSLGNEHILQEINQELNSAPKGYHSTHGKYPGNPMSDEYIVYRYGQALPYLKITYKG